MTRSLFAAALLAVGSVALAFPPRPAPSAAPAPPPMPTPADRFDLIVLGPQRPIRVAVHVQYEGKSLADRWAASLKVVFAAFDRDGDGFLNGVEVKRVFSDTSAAGLVQNGFYQPFPNDLPTLAWLDADGDGRVSFAEFAGYYRQAAAAAAQAFPPQPENPQNAAATEVLFALLDADSDGRLTRAEVAAAERLVVTRDNDEDECLSLTEVLGQGVGGGAPRPAILPPRVVVPPVTVARRGEPLSAVRDHVRTAYDWSKLGRPTGGEVARWWTDPADADVTLSFAPKAEECRVAVTTDPATLAVRGFTVAQAEPRRLVLRHGRQPIELSAFVATNFTSRGAGLRLQFLSMYDAAAKGRAFITDADLGGTNAPQYQLLRVLFDPADADADGKLTRAELAAHLEMFEAFAAPAVALTPAVTTPTLFQLLDDNRDGRLSVRELRTAWDRLAVLEPPGADGKVDAITKAAILPTAVLRLGRPSERFAVFLSPEQQPPGARGPQAGPVWFRKMDRNADGDVSRAEFVGTRAEFDAMDTDRDGLISVREADAFDAAARKQ
jgi:Ca2+-binding EF-hand superfamily protein